MAVRMGVRVPVLVAVRVGETGGVVRQQTRSDAVVMMVTKQVEGTVRCPLYGGGQGRRSEQRDSMIRPQVGPQVGPQISTDLRDPRGPEETEALTCAVR